MLRAPIGLLGLVLCVGLSAGCEAAVITAPGLSPDGDGGPSGDPEAVFVEQVQPLLVDQCAGCHEGTGGTNFLDPVDYYTSVRAYEGLVVPGDPDSSMMVTFPGDSSHTGRAWRTSEDEQTVRDWIVLEGENPDPPPPPPDEEIETTPQDLSGTRNSIGLTEIGLAGARVEFDVFYESSGIRIENIVFRAGSTGIAISGPRFVITDSMDNKTAQASPFLDSELRLSAGQMEAVDVTGVSLPDFPSDGKLSIRFDAASTID